jgi:Spy/CpxP family protein refolding chaperone
MAMDRWSNRISNIYLGLDMKHNPELKLFLLALAVGIALLFGCAQRSQAQDNPAPPAGDVSTDGQNRPVPELGRLLNLSPDQLRQVFAINQRTAPEFRRARQRMNDARDDLDNAIYGDAVDEALIATKVQEFNQAQGEFERLRTLREFRIRQILTPDQLTVLRDVRDRTKQRLNRRGQPKGGADGMRPNGRRNIQPDNGVPPGNNFRPQPQTKTTPPVKRP